MTEYFVWWKTHLFECFSEGNTLVVQWCLYKWKKTPSIPQRKQAGIYGLGHRREVGDQTLKCRGRLRIITVTHLRPNLLNWNYLGRTVLCRSVRIYAKKQWFSLDGEMRDHVKPQCLWQQMWKSNWRSSATRSGRNNPCIRYWFTSNVGMNSMISFNRTWGVGGRWGAGGGILLIEGWWLFIHSFFLHSDVFCLSEEGLGKQVLQSTPPMMPHGPPAIDYTVSIPPTFAAHRTYGTT